LDLANYVINNRENGNKGFDKNLNSDMTGDIPTAKIFSYDEQESRFVADKIRNLIHQNGEMYMRHIAVLSRAGHHTNKLEIILRTYGIETKKFGGKGYFEKAHVEDVLSLLSCAYTKNDRLAQLRVIELVKGVGKQTARKIVNDIKNENGNINITNSYEKKAFYQELKQMEDIINDLIYDTSPATLNGMVEKYFYFMENKYPKESIQKRKYDLFHLSKIAEKFPNFQGRFR